MQEGELAALKVRTATDLALTRKELLLALRMPDTTLREAIHKAAALRRINERLTRLEMLARICEAACGRL